MKVRPGYKQTEAAVIPEDWLNPQLQQITDEDSPICYGIVQVGPFVPNGIPVLAIKNLNLDYSSNIHHASVEVERPYARSRIQPEDVVVSVKGTTGRVGLVPDHFRGNISRDLARIRPRKEIAPCFIYQMLQSDLAQRRMTTATVGTTRMELSIAVLKQVCIPLPPTKAEQEAIAEALNDADALIESLEQLLAKKRNIKQGAMQELLTGKNRLPGFRGNWVLRPLVEFVKADKFAIVDGPFGTQMKVEDYVSEGVPVIEMEHLEDNAITCRFKCYITKKKFEQLRRSAVYPGDIVISKTGSLGYLGLIPENFERGIITSRLAKISLDASCANRSFIFQCLLKLRKDGYWERVSQGGTMQILGIRMLQDAPIPWISLPEQSLIAAILSDMDTEITALEEKLTKARQIKQGMMTNLLTGRIRLV